MSRAKAAGFESSDGGTRLNRALRDARASGSWLKNRQDAAATAIGLSAFTQICDNINLSRKIRDKTA
jgi:hypothetical protein